MEQVTIYNPPQFREKELVYLPAVNIYFKPLEYLFTKEFRVYSLDVDIERLTIIKNEDGSINLKVLDELIGERNPARPQKARPLKKNPLN